MFGLFDLCINIIAEVEHSGRGNRGRRYEGNECQEKKREENHSMDKDIQSTPTPAALAANLLRE